MTKAHKKVARERLRSALDAPTSSRIEFYLALYWKLDQAQLCAEPVERLKEAQRLLDQLIATYAVKQ